MTITASLYESREAVRAIEEANTWTRPDSTTVLTAPVAAAVVEARPSFFEKHTTKTGRAINDTLLAVAALVTPLYIATLINPAVFVPFVAVVGGAF